MLSIDNLFVKINNNDSTLPKPLLASTKQKTIDFIYKNYSKYNSIEEIDLDKTHKITNFYYYQNIIQPILQYLFCQHQNKQLISITEYLRPNQKMAVNNTIQHNFKSGIHCQIMGAGKSLIILNLIQSHFHIHNSIKNIYIVMTERIDILKQMFYDNKINNFNMWKSKGIINMDLFHLKENIINKSFDNTINYKKPTIWIINNAFLKKHYKNISIENLQNIKLILDDECHSVSGVNNYSMLKYFKDKNINIIGFSATPLRPVKGADDKLAEIFSYNNKLNIISSYTLFGGIRDNIILPFRHYIIHIDDINNIPQDIINKYIINNSDLPYKKGIGWTKKINDLIDKTDDGIIVSNMKKLLPNHDIYTYHSKCENDKSLQIFHTLEPTINNNEINSLLLCVNCCREGSDIQYVDYGIFLDDVKKRSILVSLQTCGRIMRPDPKKLKKYATIIEFVTHESSIEILTLNKIMDYYKTLLNLSNVSSIDEYDDINIINQFEELYNNTYIIKETNEIKIKVPSGAQNIPDKECMIKLDIDVIKIDWSLIKNSLRSEYIKITGKLELDVLKNEFNLAVENNQSLKIQTKKEYIAKINEYDLIQDPENKFSIFWTNWYDYLGVDVLKYPENKLLWKNKCNKLKLNTVKKYYNYIEKNNDMPKMPEQIYKITNLIAELEDNIMF